MIEFVVSDMVLPKPKDDVLFNQVFNCVFPGDCVPFRSGPAGSPKKSFSPSSVLVHGSFFHKVKVFGSDNVSVEFDLHVH